MAFGDLVAEDRSDGAVDVADGHGGGDFFTLLNGRFAQVQERGDVERAVDAVILHFGAEASDFRADVRLIKQIRKVDATGFPVVDGSAGLQHFRAAHHFLQRAEAKLGHEFAHFHGDEAHEIGGMLRIAAKLGAQLWILGGDADGAGVQMADAHHDAAQRDERSRGEAELLSAQQRGDDDISAGFHLAIRFDDDAAAQIVEDESLMSFSEAEFPWQAGVLHGGLRGGTGAAIETGDENDVRVCLGHTGGDSADADFGDELHTDACGTVRILQVVDELGQIFNGVDVMMRRRRDEAHTRRGAAHLGNPRINLRAWKLTTFTGLGTLGHLDLDFPCLGKIEAGDAETTGSHLLDGAVFGVTPLVGPGVTCLIFAAFTGVRLAADTVHGDGERLVRFAGDGAVAHRARLEALHDGLDGFDFFDRHRFACLKVQQAAQSVELLDLRVHQRGVLLEGFVVAGADSLLQGVDRERIEEMCLAFLAPLVITADVEGVDLGIALWEAAQMTLDGFFGDDLDVAAFNAGGGPGEVFVHYALAETDGFKDLCAAIALHRGDADLRGDLDDALGGGLDEVIHRRLVVDLDQQTLTDHVVESFESEVRIDRSATVADERAEVMHFARFARFQHEVALGAGALADQVMMQAAHGEQGRDGSLVSADTTVGKDQDVPALGDQFVCFGADPGHGFFEADGTLLRIKQDVDGGGFELSLSHVFELGQIFVAEDRRLELDQMAAFGRRIEQVALSADGSDWRSDDFLAYTVDRRVRDLGEELFEVVVKQLRFVGQDGQRNVGAHGADGFHALSAHGNHELAQVFKAVTKGLLTLQHGLVVRRGHWLTVLDVSKVYKVLVQPFAVRFFSGDLRLDFIIRDDAAFLHVHDEHFARL